MRAGLPPAPAYEARPKRTARTDKIPGGPFNRRMGGVGSRLMRRFPCTVVFQKLVEGGGFVAVHFDAGVEGPVHRFEQRPIGRVGVLVNVAVHVPAAFASHVVPAHHGVAAQRDQAPVVVDFHEAGYFDELGACFGLFHPPVVVVADDEVLAALELARDHARRFGASIGEIAQHVHIVIVGHLRVPPRDQFGVHFGDIAERAVVQADDVRMPEVGVGNVVDAHGVSFRVARGGIGKGADALPMPSSYWRPSIRRSNCLL